MNSKSSALIRMTFCCSPLFGHRNFNCSSLFNHNANPLLSKYKIFKWVLGLFVKINKPVISLVICTRNRSARLPMLFQALNEIKTFLNFELIFVNNGSEDDTAKALHAFAASCKYSVKIIFETINQY